MTIAGIEQQQGEFYLRYTNNSNYKNDTMLRKEVFNTPVFLKDFERIISYSEIMKEDDNNWPEPDRVGRHELEIVMGNEHLSFTTPKIGSLVDLQSNRDSQGLPDLLLSRCRT